MKQQFEQFLINEGYKQTTPSGHKSTVYDYLRRIDSVCQLENTDWNGLALNISHILPKYDVGGSMAEYGAKSHNSVRIALKCFQKFTYTL